MLLVPILILWAPGGSCALAWALIPHPCHHFESSRLRHSSHKHDLVLLLGTDSVTVLEPLPLLVLIEPVSFVPVILIRSSLISFHTVACVLVHSRAVWMAAGSSSFHR